MNKKILSIFLALLTAITFSGCGMISLTDDEEEQIALYSASLVRKYNKGQEQAISYYGQKSKDIYDIIESQTSTKTDTASSSDNATDSADTALNTDSNTADESIDTSSDGGDSSVSSNALESKSLDEIVGVSGITFSVSGTDIVDSYTKEGLFDLSHKNGDRFFEIDVTCTNTTSNDIKVDFSQLGISYSCELGGKSVYSTEGLLPNGLSTFNGTVKANSSTELVLLFDFSSDILSGDTSNYILRAKSQDGAFRVS